ncbi:MAG TPA: alanine--tRNA ligase-related protein, partial [Pyrinomonadaceae bacterium]|nr:alanine--tRNA ligase-related protein [Pyrinomonadaceae bacterium]
MSAYDNFDEQKRFACRVIADHARATAFSIADGILPGNEGRNYVLRKIMRRAIYQGKHTLGLDGLFFYKVTDFVVDQMGEPYPELEASREFIEKMVKLEEERFGATMTVGLQKLDELFANAKGSMPEYKTLARLYDTFGTPRDLIRVSLEERGFVVQEDDFNAAFDKALQALQEGGTNEKADAKAKVSPALTAMLNTLQRSQFKGYETTRVENASVLAIAKGESVAELRTGEEGDVVLDRTPFYAESGGQVGDTGELQIPGVPSSITDGNMVERLEKFMNSLGGTKVIVTDTYSPAQGLIVHKVKVEKGTLKVGDVV